ncbi:MAG: hypothetical protein R3178_07795, partial [Rhodothermales bacterium]|nr:hypothetical protein [Rhodothermales bacterium]
MTVPSIPGASDYLAGRTTFLAGLHPRRAIELPLEAVLDLLRQRFGTPIETALSLPAVDLARPVSELPDEVRSPRRGESDSTWLKRTNMVGVNIRTVEDYAGLIKYTLTLSGAFDSIHLLPIWEPGVVESLYGIAGWNLNKEFWSQELFDVAPHLDTVDRQLRATSNLLHVMGRTIGMDVIPHTDRFSEVAVGNPQLFEWMVVRDRTIVDHSASLHERAMVQVHQWLIGVGSATAGAAMPTTVAELFAIPEEQRLAILFGDPDDFLARIERRVDLIKHLKRQGLEPVPATMGVPFRGIKVDPDVQHTAIDDDGLEWPDYVITRPEGMSRVFSPLARFKLYGSLDDNAEWEMDFADRRTEVWDYVCERYARVQQIGNFDFMRGDMSHVQMRPDGVPSDVDEFYDILGAVKRFIQRSADAPWFAYFAETFLPPRDTFQYGEELDHLDVSLADATLGDLQSTVVGSPVFLQRFRRYLDDLATRHTAPAFTLMTADKDDPRFDEFYRAGNEVRMFTALFLPDMPSYMGLGFEVRDVHWEPVENERYTKLFVFREKGESNIYPSKARHGNEFLWGENRDLFERLTALRRYADEILPGLKETSTRWLIPPDSTAHRGIA